MVEEIVIPYAPRAAFRAYHSATQRYCLTVAHRRAGKTVARINKLIRAAILCPLPRARYGYLAPTFVQAKDIAWGYVKYYAAPLLARGGRVNEAELSVVLPNEATIRLYGAESAERLRGLYFDGICVDEAQLIAPSVLTQIILPALADRQGWLDIAGTAGGWGNLLGDTYKRASGDPEWFTQVLRASETGIIPADELARLAKSMPANEYAAEMECSFDAAIVGAYYAAELDQAHKEGRIGRVPHDPTLLVHTAWDLGVADSTSIWMYQTTAREIRLIDYYEAAGYGLDHYARVLRDRGYLYGTHIGPHDLEVRELGTGKSRREIANGLGIKFAVAKSLSVADGINAVRMTLPRMWIDADRCAAGLDALRQYRQKLDDKRQISLGPLHDWTSHAADAMRYLCVGLQEERVPRRATRIQAYNWAGRDAWMGA